MRTLTANATTEKNSTATAPYKVVRIDWGGALGTKWYSDRDIGNADASAWNHAESRVVAWSILSGELSEQQFNASDDVALTLRDEDKSIWAQWTTAALQNARGRVQQRLHGLVWAAAVLVVDGRVPWAAARNRGAGEGESVRGGATRRPREPCNGPAAGGSAPKMRAAAPARSGS